MNEKVEQKLREKIRATIKEKLSEAITGADRKILFILIRDIVRNLKPKIKNMDVNNKSHIDRVGSSILGIIRAMTYTPDNANYKNFKKYFPKNFNNKLVQKKLKQFHSQNDKVQVTLVTQAIKNELSEGKLTEFQKIKLPKGKAKVVKTSNGWELLINNGKTTFTLDLGNKDRKFRFKGNKLNTTEKDAINFSKKLMKHSDFKGLKLIEGKLSENKIYSKKDGLKIVKKLQAKDKKIYKVDKQKATYDGKKVLMYNLYTKDKSKYSGNNLHGLDMARNSKGEAMYLVPIQESGKQIAKTILQQLGGNKFIAMTGAKNLGFTDKGLQMKIGRNSKGVTHVIIELDRGKDLYNIEFVQVRNFKRKTIKKLKGIYADQLGEIFTRYTGLRIRL